MDIPLYRCNDKRRHLLSIVLLLQHRLEIINGKFHGICTGNQLRQEIFFLFKKFPDFIDGCNQLVIDDLLRLCAVCNCLFHFIYNASFISF